jgi:hypothetical protein
MYSFNQRSDTIVMDEPFYGIRLKKLGKRQPYFDEVMLRMECDDATKIHDEIENNENIKGNVFVKNMVDTVQDMKENRLSKYRHIFLIRDPAETIVSLMNKTSSITADDLCLADQGRIYDWLKENTNENPIVIDASELRRDPAAVLIKTCKRLGLPFTSKMLSWPAGPKSIDGLWAQASYTDVHASTGFRPPSTTKITRDNIPNNLVLLYDDAVPFYQRLLTHCM